MPSVKHAAAVPSTARRLVRAGEAKRTAKAPGTPRSEERGESQRIPGSFLTPSPLFLASLAPWRFAPARTRPRYRQRRAAARLVRAGEAKRTAKAPGTPRSEERGES